ncbi:stage V sporulation protein E [Paenalkalicoccus suaedae]|uniref:Stage V sporulation protein E n=1 Tax=Paenalkalicoccus suaedae TaxID=2592382 RepID=A0A859FDT6_9BACI|nr:stage V sporulation protein E [Paenalkalicoccus suaedae]QKS71523.1 stage V sporulation protein E [Paenalkalicoccus suaedae]
MEAEVFLLSYKRDWWLLSAITVLIIFGLLMVYSASSVWGEFRFSDPLFFAKRQSLFVCIGILLMIVLSKVHYSIFATYSYLLVAGCFLFLILVLIPGVGLVRGGAQSWLGVGIFSIQPSEFMKLGLILFLSKRLSMGDIDIASWKGLFHMLLWILAAFGLIMLQPDLGTGTVLVGTCIAILFVGGASLKHFFVLFLGAVAGFVALIASAPYRLKRITAFLDPWEDPLGAGFQSIQSLYAVGPGGLLGTGFGGSRQKHFYLPEPQTDFIFAITAEELGFIGACLILLAFFVLFWRGIRIAILAPDRFSSYVATGITSMIMIQVFINISVVIGLMPVTGITLPFFSYGGSSYTLLLVGLGILMNISRQIKR